VYVTYRVAPKVNAPWGGCYRAQRMDYPETPTRRIREGCASSQRDKRDMEISSRATACWSNPGSTRGRSTSIATRTGSAMRSRNGVLRKRRHAVHAPSYWLSSPFQTREARSFPTLPWASIRGAVAECPSCVHIRASGSENGFLFDCVHYSTYPEFVQILSMVHIRSRRQVGRARTGGIVASARTLCYNACVC
jgi:hypothetical protein